MRLTPKTKGLLGVALLSGLAALLPRSADPSLSPMPTLPAIDAKLVERIEISRGPFEKIILSLDDAGNTIDAPIEASADTLLIEALLREFRSELPMDVRVDEGNFDSYGLQNETQIVLEMFGSTETPMLSFAMGASAPGGSSFVRLNDSDTVYRARVGPRHRIDRPASDWRDKMVVSLDSSSLVSMAIRSNQLDLPFQRSPTGNVGADGSLVYGPWHLPGEEVDSVTLKTLASSLSRIRASEILSEGFDGGFEPPAATVQLTAKDGEPIQLLFGSRIADGGAFVRIGGQDATYRIAKSRLDLVQRPLSAYRNLQVLKFDLGSATTISWEDESPRRTLERREDGVWSVIEPKNTDSDLARIAAGLGALSSLRGQQISSTETIDVLSSRLNIRFADGRDTSLVAGQSPRDSRSSLWLVQVDGSPLVYEVKDPTWTAIRQAFGRGG